MPPCIGLQRAQLVPRLLAASAGPSRGRGAARARQMIHWSSRASPGRVDRLAHQLHAALGVGHGPAGRLAPRRRRREDDVGHLARLGHEDVLGDHEVQALQQRERALGVGLGLRGVLAQDVERRELAALHAVEHLRQVPAALGRELAVPRRLEARAGLHVVLDVLEAGQLVGDRAHVAAALDVVLPAQRVQARAVAPDVAGQQREVDERQDVVDRGDVLGDPQRPAQDRAVGARVGVGHLADDLRPARRSRARPPRASTARPTRGTPRSPSSSAR